tara:strand:- start:566 stop:1381 length:816 start_codon:yes stop_codon:yes gene_type:complete
MKKNKITMPLNDGHSGDTFRELVKLWHENKLIDLELKDVHNCWMNGVNNILLYDQPTLEWFKPQRDLYNFALFGNIVPSFPSSSAWIFWGRRPRLMEKIKKNRKNWANRDIGSIFLGKIENSVQLTKRTNEEWENEIDLFSMPIGGNYKYSQEEYLNLLCRSKFGLCLSGYGPKCNREIELMCMGVVPIITPLVDLTYYSKLEENKHYIRVNSPREIKQKINDTSQYQWGEMSNNCIDWFEKNCSTEGSFNTTIEILQKKQQTLMHQKKNA